MIIPVLCVTCSKVIADKYRYYTEQVRMRKKGKPDHGDVYFVANSTEKTAEAKVLDDMNILKPCCRRHFLTHVDI